MSEATQIEITPRLWGEWAPRFYGSGTTIVGLCGHQHKPHLYIYADSSIDDGRYQRDRMKMCDELADFMNGHARPVWLDDFERTSENCATSLMGGSIDAVGPMVDCDPPKLHWVRDETDEASDDRARLMDVLFNKQ